MENVLKARIVGDISDYKAKMAEAERITESATKEIVNLEGALAGLKAEYKAGSIDVDQYSKQLARLNNQLQDQRQVLNNARGSMRAIGGDVNQATGTFQELNRVIQDAPFGIIGVGNNLQQLAGSFGQLSQQAGGTRAALALTFKSLISGINPAILAVSAITTAFTLYNMGVFDSKEETESLTESLEKYRESLDLVSRASIEGASSAQKELQSLNLLRAQIDNENVSRQDKLRAVDELQKKYPDYLGNLTDEQILAGDVGSAYDDLSKSIIATAKARAASDEIAKKALNILTLEQQKATAEAQKVPEAVIKATQETNKFATGVTGIGDQLQRQQALRNDNFKLDEEIKNANEAIKKENEEIEKLTSFINQNISEGARFINDQAEGNKKNKKEVEFYDKLWQDNEARLLRIIQLTSKIAEGLPDGVTVPKDAPVQETADVVPTGVIEGLKQQISLFQQLREQQTDTVAIDEYGAKIVELQEKLKGFDLAKEQTTKANDVLINSFSALGGQIANAFGISNDALRGFVSTLLSSAPKIIQAINAQAQAKKAASASNVSSSITEASAEGVVIGTKAASALGPVGLALLPVFIGGALAIIQSAFGKGGGGGGSSPTLGQGSSFTNRREFGGPVAAGRAYIVGEKRPEIFVPNTNGTIIPKMPDMNYGGMANGMASGMNVNLSGSFRIDKNDLLYVIEQGLVERRLT